MEGKEDSGYCITGKTLGAFLPSSFLILCTLVVICLLGEHPLWPILWQCNALLCRGSGFQKTGSLLFPFWDGREVRRSPGIEGTLARNPFCGFGFCLTFCRLSREREREKIETSR